MKKSVCFFLILLLVVLFTGCGKQGAPPPVDTPPADQGNTPDNGTDLGDSLEPSEIDAWLENSKNLFLAQSKELDGQQYLLVTYGMKPSGGYNVDIIDVLESDDMIAVTVEFTKPAPGQSVTQAITFPYDLAVINATGLPVEFIPTGDEFYIPLLLGIEELKPIVAQSAGIKAFAPEPGAVVGKKFTAEGVANVFEGNVLYKVYDDNNTVLVSGFTTATMGDWGYFLVNVTVDDSISVKELLLELYTQSAKDGSIQDLVQIDLSIE
ncbi:MAG: protease complex subunit PrcB family protein [Clostridiales bacterium]|jgi:predicted small lipoprotein YifL|nr:protease complex subunit PrcB family protein [Clostridiales bacterium]